DTDPVLLGKSTGWVGTLGTKPFHLTKFAQPGRRPGRLWPDFQKHRLDLAEALERIQSLGRQLDSTPQSNQTLPRWHLGESEEVSLRELDCRKVILNRSERAQLLHHREENRGDEARRPQLPLLLPVRVDDDPGDYECFVRDCTHIGENLLGP